MVIISLYCRKQTRPERKVNDCVENKMNCLYYLPIYIH